MAFGMGFATNSMNIPALTGKVTEFQGHDIFTKDKKKYFLEIKTPHFMWLPKQLPLPRIWVHAFARFQAKQCEIPPRGVKTGRWAWVASTISLLLKTCRAPPFYSLRTLAYRLLSSGRQEADSRANVHVVSSGEHSLAATHIEKKRLKEKPNWGENIFTLGFTNSSSVPALHWCYATNRTDQSGKVWLVACVASLQSQLLFNTMLVLAHDDTQCPVGFWLLAY